MERLRGQHSDAQAWAKGAAGEKTTAAALRKLTDPPRQDPQWFLLNSIQVSDSGTDIDHVLIGPAGIYTINTKNHPGTTVWVTEKSLTANRYNHNDYIRKATAEAESGASKPTVQPPRWPKFAITNPILDPGQVDSIHATARRSTTWLPHYTPE